MGSFIVVNDEGWLLTVAHLFQAQLTLPAHRKEMETYEAAKAARKKAPGPKRNPKWLVDLSFWWGRDGVAATDVVANFELDLAVTRLAPFDPLWITEYPAF